MKKDNSIRLRLFKQHKRCPSGTMLSMVTRYLWGSFLFNPDEGKLHQVHLLFYCGDDLLACWCILHLLHTSRRSKWSTSVNSYLKKWPFALTSKETIPIFWWSPSTKDKDTPTFGGDCKWHNLNCKAPAALQHWLLALWGNQPGRAAEGEWL